MQTRTLEEWQALFTDLPNANTVEHIEALLPWNV